MNSEEKIGYEGAEKVEQNTDTSQNFPIYPNVQNQEEMNPVKSSNIITGTTGAFLGSLIGVAIWMLIYHFGYIASIAGLIIIICAMKGYEILGGALDKKGVIIVGIVSIVMVFVANHLSWTMDVYIELKDYQDISFVEVFHIMPNLIKEFNLLTDYLKDLGLGYLLTLVGGASTLSGSFRRA